MSIWHTKPTDFAADMAKAKHDIENQRVHPLDPCLLGLHVVHPAARERGGWAICGCCAAPVNVVRRGSKTSPAVR